MSSFHDANDNGSAESTESKHIETPFILRDMIQRRKEQSGYISPVNGCHAVEEKDDVLAVYIMVNIEKLYEKLELIAKQEKIAKFPVPGASIDLAFLSGSNISVAALIDIWGKGFWRSKCTICGDDVFLVSVAGSPLSGRNRCSGYCRNCGKVFGSVEDFGPVVWKTARDITKIYRADISLLKQIQGKMAQIRTVNEDIKIKIASLKKTLEDVERKISENGDSVVSFELTGQLLDNLINRRRELMFAEQEIQKKNDNLMEEYLEKYLEEAILMSSELARVADLPLPDQVR